MRCFIPFHNLSSCFFIELQKHEIRLSAFRERKEGRHITRREARGVNRNRIVLQYTMHLPLGKKAKLKIIELRSEPEKADACYELRNQQ